MLGDRPLELRLVVRILLGVLLSTVVVGPGASAEDADGDAMMLPAPVAPVAAGVARTGPVEAETPAAPVVVWSADPAASAPVGSDDELGARIITMLDHVVPFAWRRYVSELVVGCRPVGELACPGGVVDRRDRITISPAARGWTEAELAYVLRHELAHVWQFATGDLAARRRDLDGVAGLGDVDRLEAGAECLAALWGSPSDGAGYLDCPAAGVRRMARRFSETPLKAMMPGSGVDAAADARATTGPEADCDVVASPSSTARTAASVRPVTPSFR